jgi:hypothetical protein
VAATPEEKAIPYWASSKEAISSSSEFLVGFAVLEYSKPLFLPMASCWYVEVW